MSIILSNFGVMKKEGFHFRQFYVRHDRCAMKVGTDGVLLGAWCDVEGALRALDVGTGCGLVALMLAQRNEKLRVWGIDIDVQATAQAADNFSASPFAERLEAACADFLEASPLTGDGAFDLIVSNPPFFTEQTAAPDAARQRARQADSLPLGALVERAARCLAPDGRLDLILPHGRAEECVWLCLRQGLHLRRRTDVRSRPERPFSRTLLEFGRTRAEASRLDTLTLLDSDGYRRSAAYEQLARDFYL